MTIAQFIFICHPFFVPKALQNYLPYSLKGSAYTFISEFQILSRLSFLHQWTIQIVCSLVIRDWKLHLPTSYLPEPLLAIILHIAQLPPSHRH